MKQPKAILRGAIVLYFVIGLEILIMIGPAAGFFYAAFNPFLLSLAKSPATRWLTAFYLPHMVLPPDLFLKIIRVAGSFLFVAGCALFLLCAGQVYYHKFARKGVALGGLYSRIRHPQYLGLGMAGIGLSILWPRFLVIALWAVMATLYFLLAKDEERRMLGQFGDEYRRYMDRTGMFLPRGVEGAIGKMFPIRSSAVRATAVFLLLFAVTLGGLCSKDIYGRPPAALVRWTRHRAGDPSRGSGDDEVPDGGGIGAAGDPDASRSGRRAVPRVLHAGGLRDAGDDRRHGRGVAVVPAPPDGCHDLGLTVDPRGKSSTPADDFGIDAIRIPRFVSDVDIHTLELKDVRDLPPGTGWGKVPTPIF